MEKEFIDLRIVDRKGDELIRLPYIYHKYTNNIFCENVCIYGKDCHLKKSPIDPNKTLENFCDSTLEGLGKDGDDPRLLESTPGYGTLDEETNYYMNAINCEEVSNDFCESICEFRDPDYCKEDRCNLRDNIKINEITIVR